MKSRIFIDATTFLGKVWRLARPYWFSEERWGARGLLAAILALTLGLVYLAVLFNDWNREFYTSLEQKNYADFQDLLLYFCLLAAVYIATAVYKLYLTQMLEMRWRVWLTREYLGDGFVDVVDHGGAFPIDERPQAIARRLVGKIKQRLDFSIEDDDGLFVGGRRR